MKKTLILFYILFITSIFIITLLCLSIALNYTLTSFPWWVHIVYPGILFTIFLLCFSLFITYKYKRYLELIIIIIIFLLQIILLI